MAAPLDSMAGPRMPPDPPALATLITHADGRVTATIPTHPPTHKLTHPHASNFAITGVGVPRPDAEGP